MRLARNEDCPEASRKTRQRMTCSRPSGSRTVETHDALAVPPRRGGTPALEHPGPAPARVREQRLVELVAADLIGVRERRGEAVLEPVRHVPAAVVGHEARAVLAARVREVAHGLVHAESVEQRKRVRQQRLADVEAREALALDDQRLDPRRRPATPLPCCRPARPRGSARRRCALAATAKVYLVSLQLPEDHPERVELARSWRRSGARNGPIPGERSPRSGARAGAARYRPPAGTGGAPRRCRRSDAPIRAIRPATPP